MKTLAIRWATVLPAFFLIACVASTSVTRTGTEIFAPKQQSEEDDEEAPRGLSLSIASIAADGTAVLDLRNYSMEPFVFYGSPERPRLIIEINTGSSYSRHTISQWTRMRTHEVPAGERIRLNFNLADASGRIRIGVRSHDYRYVVWTDWFSR